MALLQYLQVNLPRWAVQAGVIGEVLQPGFSQWVSPSRHSRVAGCGGPWAGLVVGDLVGTVCPSSLGEVQTWAGEVRGELSGGG